MNLLTSTEYKHTIGRPSVLNKVYINDILHLYF